MQDISRVKPQDQPGHIPQWKRVLYLIQLQAPKPKKVECHIDIPSRPPYYGSEFHGELSRHETDDLLAEDGCYLVRESQRNPGCYTLAIRFENATKNFKLYYDTNTCQHYVGEKYFENLDDLVADGLICFYVNLKAPEYIASMANDPQYEESPYMRYREEVMKRERNVHLPPNGKPTGRALNALDSTDQKPMLPPRISEGSTRRPPPAPSTDPPSRSDPFKGIPSAQLAGDWMDIMQQEKPHKFKTTTFKSIALCWCDFCFHFMWGLIQQGVECQDCGFRAHKKCSEKIPNDCMPSMKKLKRMFGLELTTLLKATNKSVPYVVEKCVEEIEKRGLTYEGLYRVPGSKDHVDEIQRAFDLEGDADVSQNHYEDIAVITSVLKSFLQQLPLPLVPFEIYPTLTLAASRSSIKDMKSALAHLPTGYYQTLKYIICHLNRVIQLEDRNKMSIANLSTVFAPTILQSPMTDRTDFTQEVKKVGQDQRAMELLITNCSNIFDR